MRIRCLAAVLLALAGCQAYSPSPSPSRSPAPATRAAPTAVSAVRPRPVASPGFHIEAELPLGGAGPIGQLTADRDAKRLYIPRGDSLAVVDMISGDTLASVSPCPGIRGVALSKRIRRGFTCNSTDNSVTLFNLDTLQVLGRVPVGTAPQTIVYDQATRRVVCLNQSDASLFDAEVDPAAPLVIATVPLKGRPSAGLADGAENVFVALEDTSEIVRINMTSAVVADRWPLQPHQAPTALAMDLKAGRLFVACDNRTIAVLDAQSGRILAVVPLSARAQSLAFDPDLSLLFAACADGKLAVVQEDPAQRYRMAQVLSLKTQGTPMLALDSLAHRVYLAGTHPAAGVTITSIASPQSLPATRPASQPSTRPAMQP